jgi:hypothetical protein
MTSGMCRTLIASLGAVALVLAASETFAAGITHIEGVAPPPPTFHPTVRSLHHLRGLHHQRGTGGFFPTAEGYFYGPSYDEPMVDPRQPGTSDDIRYTCVYDIPWDYVHRCPQVVAPRD